MRNRSKKYWLLCSLLLPVVFALTLQAATLEDFSLNSRLSLSARPMPCSLSGEIKTEAPCENAFFKWNARSLIDLDLRVGNVDYFLDSSLSIPHPEHLVLGLETDVAEITVEPEIWFAVPFQGVVDANNISTSVVVPPGDPLFVAARMTASWNIDNFRFKNLFMYEDVNFPGSGSPAQEDWSYGPQFQKFKTGDIFYLTGRMDNGVYFSSRTSFCADGSTSVKNYSASGGVDGDCENPIQERLSIGGLSLGDVRLSETIDVKIGEDTGVTSRTGFTLSPFDWASFGTSLTADITSLDLGMGSISVGLSFSISPFRLSVSLGELEELEFRTATASFHQRFALDMINGAFSGSATLQNEGGLTGVSMSLFASQGTVSTSTSVSFSKSDNFLKFTYLNTRINLRLTPFTFTATPSFSENGLRRLAITTGVMF